MESPNRETRNQADHTLSYQRRIVTNCEVITKADIGSSHRLVRVTLRINKGLARLKTIKDKKKINTQKLTGMKEMFKIYLKNIFEKLEEVIASNFSEIMKEGANILAGKTKEESPLLSTEDQEIKQLKAEEKN